MKKKGFTLIELMIVVAIIAILAAAALPAFGDQIKKSKDGKAVQFLGTLRSTLGMATADLEGVPPTTATIQNILNGGTIEGNGDSTLTANTKGVQKWNRTAAWAAAAGTINAGTPANVAVAYTIDGNNNGSMDITTANLDTKGKNWTSY